MRSPKSLRFKIATGAFAFLLLACGRSTSTPARDGWVGTAGTIPTGGTMDTGGTPTTDGSPGDGGATATGGITNTGGASVAGGAVAAVPFPPKFFGNIDSPDGIPLDFATYWDQFTPANRGKWSAVQSPASPFDWTALDAMYAYCEEHNILFKEHCFIWGSEEPAWITSDNAAALAQEWMKTFCDRYPKTRIIDVVNEPLHSPPYYRNGLGGTGASGWDWIVNSFKWAREACPNAILVLNDYNIIEYSYENKKIIELTKAILAAGAPVMAIGAQSHEAAKVSITTMQSYLTNIVKQTGLPVYITELDLGVADDMKQAELLKEFVTTFWNDPNVPGITYWGYLVGQTWRANTGLMSTTGTMRPAMTWLMDFLHR